MALKSTIELLPDEIQAWIRADLIQGGFIDYVGFTERLNAYLAEKGLEVRLGKSAVHSFGQKLERSIEAMKTTAAIARTVQKEIGDDDGATNDLMQRVLLTKIHLIVEQLEVNVDDTKAISTLSHAVADLTRASVGQKKYQEAVRRRAKEVADSAASSARKGGLSAEAAEKIRRDILGIAK